MSDKDFGSGDFTIEGWLPGIKELTPDGWMHVPIKRESKRTIVHHQEEFEGVLFVSCRVYGADGRLESVTLTRADLVRGAPESDSAPPGAQQQ